MSSYTCDVMIALYSGMFSWVVNRINQSLASTVDTASTIGVLDIFGFEIFASNGFEQFCINYANEKLQQHFNDHIFKQEQAMYKEENISFEGITFADNEPCVDLIESKVLGILAILDEQISMVCIVTTILLVVVQQLCVCSVTSSSTDWGVSHYCIILCLHSQKQVMKPSRVT